LIKSQRKALSKFKMPETQFQRTVKDKIDYKTHLKSENDCFKYIFEILIKFPIQQHEKTLENLIKSGRKAVSNFEMSETQFERTVRDKIDYKTHLK